MFVKEYYMHDEEASKIAIDFVTFHGAHTTALKARGLSYLDKVLDCLVAQTRDLTARELAWELQRMVPDLSTETAHALISAKFLGVNFDHKVN